MLKFILPLLVVSVFCHADQYNELSTILEDGQNIDKYLDVSMASNQERATNLNSAGFRPFSKNNKGELWDLNQANVKEKLYIKSTSGFIEGVSQRYQTKNGSNWASPEFSFSELGWGSQGFLKSVPYVKGAVKCNGPNSCVVATRAICDGMKKHLGENNGQISKAIGDCKQLFTFKLDDHTKKDANDLYNRATESLANVDEGAGWTTNKSEKDHFSGQFFISEGSKSDAVKSLNALLKLNGMCRTFDNQANAKIVEQPAGGPLDYPGSPATGKR